MGYDLAAESAGFVVTDRQTKLKVRVGATGLNATDVVAALTAAHAEGQSAAGLDVATGQPRDLSQYDITDLHSSKW